MKAVLLSIKPKYCELIERGEKTIELRKSEPKLKPPFKCYIYESKSFLPNKRYSAKTWARSGKVIGEFICDKIYHYTADYYRSDYVESLMNITDEEMEKGSCLSRSDMYAYEESDNNYKWGLLGWHISDLVIYDKPKELSEFYYPPDKYFEKNMCGGCPYDEATIDGEIMYGCEGKRPLIRPPQSWCYVEEQEA